MTDKQRTQIKELRLAGYSYKKIAQALYLSENTVKSYCRRSMTKIEAKESISVCAQCGKPIDISKRSARRFCSDACRNKWWNEHPKSEMPYSASCACCGKKIHMRRRNEKSTAPMPATSRIVMRAVAEMNNRSNIQAYQSAMAQANIMLERGIIDENDIVSIEDKLAHKYGLKFGSIFREYDLINLGFRVNISDTRGVI